MVDPSLEWTVLSSQLVSGCQSVVVSQLLWLGNWSVEHLTAEATEHAADFYGLGGKRTRDAARQ